MPEIPDVRVRATDADGLDADVVRCLEILAQTALEMEHEYATAVAYQDRAEARVEQMRRSEHALPVMVGHDLMQSFSSIAFENSLDMLDLYVTASCSYAAAAASALRITLDNRQPTVRALCAVACEGSDIHHLKEVLGPAFPAKGPEVESVIEANLERQAVLDLVHEGTKAADYFKATYGESITCLADLNRTDFFCDWKPQKIHSLGETCHFELAKLFGSPFFRRHQRA